MSPIDDQTLNESLARLTTVDIPQGLEQRILASLATHTAAHTASRPTTQPKNTIAPPHRPSHTSRLVRFSPASVPKPATLGWAALATAAAATIIAVLGHTISPAPSTPPQPSLAIQSHLPNPQPLSPASIDSRQAQTQQAQTQAQTQGTPSPAVESATSIYPTKGQQQSTAARLTTPSDPDTDLALAETNAPSQLAPPLALTEDERTLLQLARRSTPATLATLDAAHRAAQQAEDNAAFDAFFTPPAPPTKPSGESE